MPMDEHKDQLKRDVHRAYGVDPAALDAIAESNKSFWAMCAAAIHHQKHNVRGGKKKLDKAA